MGCGIYLITSLVNGKRYVGSSVTLSIRLMKHKYMLRSNSHDNKYLQNTYNKYGEDNFEFSVIENCDESELVVRENHYINLYESNDLNKGYNLSLVTDCRRNKFSDDTKVHMSIQNLKARGNYTKFKSINLLTNEEVVFNNLNEAANHLLDNDYSNGKIINVKQKISQCLRGLRVNNGSKNGSIRKTSYGHKWEIIH